MRKLPQLRPEEALPEWDEPCMPFHFPSGYPAWIASANTHRNSSPIDHMEHVCQPDQSPSGNSPTLCLRQP